MYRDENVISGDIDKKIFDLNVFEILGNTIPQIRVRAAVSKRQLMDISKNRNYKYNEFN